MPAGMSNFDGCPAEDLDASKQLVSSAADSAAEGSKSTVTTLGWLNAAAARASTSSRSAVSGGAA
jgi:hypothetical protein